MRWELRNWRRGYKLAVGIQWSEGPGILLNILRGTEVSSQKCKSTEVEKPWVRMVKHLVIKEINFLPLGRRRIILKSGWKPNEATGIWLTDWKNRLGEILLKSLLLRSFNGPEPGGLESTIRKWKKERKKEANIPWITQKTNKALGQSLFCSHRHRAPSQEVLRGLGSLGRKMSLAGLCAPWNQPERERERERRARGPKSLVEQGCLIEFCVSNIYHIIR